MSVKDLVNLRRQIDSATDFVKKPGQAASSDVSQRAMRLFGNRLRGVIAEVAESFGDDSLLLANRRYYKILETGDDLKSIAPMRDRTKEGALKSWEALAFKFQKGGIRGENIEGLASRIPGAYNAINDAVDAATAIHFVRPPLGTPSSVFKDAVRFMFSPQVMSVGIKSAPTIKQAARLGLLGSSQSLGVGSIVTDDLKARILGEGE